MKTLIASTCTALMIAASSMAFAANNDGKNNNNDADKTGSISSPDTPTQFDIDRCKTAPADDKTCDAVRSRME